MEYSVSNKRAVRVQVDIDITGSSNVLCVSEAMHLTAQL